MCSLNLNGPRPTGLRGEVGLLGLFLGQDRGRAGEEVVARVDPVGDGHLERVVVDLLEAGDLLGLALLDVDRALDQPDVARAGIALAAVHDAGERPDDVVGRHLAAVVEVGVVAQLVGVDEAVVRDRDRLRELQRQLVVGGVPIVQRAMDRLVDDVVLRARRDLRIEAAEARGIGRGHADHAALARRLLLRSASPAPASAKAATANQTSMRINHPLLNKPVGRHSIAPDARCKRNAE